MELLNTIHFVLFFQELCKVFVSSVNQRNKNTFKKYPAMLNRTSTWSCSLARASTWSFLVTSTTLVLIPDNENKNKDSSDHTCTAFIFITADFTLVHEVIQDIAASLINHFHSYTAKQWSPPKALRNKKKKPF